ncbi:MAG: amino acid ABC transporter permease [Lachnospiraceae bacterium]|nr:amino acid ABC transporter permease [Lachnospiraceae bacterium]
MFDTAYAAECFRELLKGVPATINITILSVLLGLIVGYLFAFFRIKKVPLLRTIVSLLVSLIRSTPILVQLYVVSYGLPRIIAFVHSDPTLVSKVSIVPMRTAVITFTIYAAAYFSEIYRAAYYGIEDGQLEAARSLSLPEPVVLFRIIVPQAVGSVIPNLSNSVIDILKNTSLVYTISVMDIMAKAAVVASIRFKYIEVYVDALLIYLLLGIAFMLFFAVIEKILGKRKFCR